MHFSVLVLTEAGTPEQVAAALERYDEAREVEPYQAPCPCVGLQARLASLPDPGDQLIELKKIAVEMWRKLRLQAMASIDPAEKTLLEAEAEEVFAGQVEFEKQIRLVERGRQEAHPLAGKADPDCPDCSGSGQVLSTTNPEGEWDWYEIGGRWSRSLPNASDTMPVSQLLDDENFALLEIPWAVVSPEGWLLLNDFSWSGSPVEKSPAQRRSLLRDILARHREMVAVMVDTHS